MAIIYLDRPVQPGDPVGSVYDPTRAQTSNLMGDEDILQTDFIINPTQGRGLSGIATSAEPLLAQGSQLADIQEIEPGAFVDRTSVTSVNDLFNYYYGGMPSQQPVTETPAVEAGAVVTPAVDTGVQDQATGDLLTTDELIEQGLTPTGVATITPNVFDYEAEAAGVQPTGLDPNVFDYESEAAGVQPTGISPNVFDYESEAAGVQPTGISPNVFDYEFEATTPEQRAEALTQEQIEDTGIVDKAINAISGVSRQDVINAVQAGKIGLAALTGGTSEVINQIAKQIGGAIITDAAADIASDKLLQQTGAITPTSTAEDIQLNLQQQQAALDPDQDIFDEVALTGGEEDNVNVGTNQQTPAEQIYEADVEAGLATESIFDEPEPEPEPEPAPAPSPPAYDFDDGGSDNGGGGGGGSSTAGDDPGYSGPSPFKKGGFVNAKR